LNYLRLTGRDPARVHWSKPMPKRKVCGVRLKTSAEPVFTDLLELDLSTVQPSLAGPKRPQDRVLLADMASTFKTMVWQGICRVTATEKHQVAWPWRAKAIRSIRAMW
jgi:aconitate hydratase